MCGSKDEIRHWFRQAIELGDSVLMRTFIRMYSDTAIFKQLLKEESFDGFTAIQRTCLSRNHEIVAMLLNSGCDLNDRGKHGWSSMHAASFSGCTKIVKLLLNSCGNVLDKDVHGCLPVDLADNYEVRDLLTREMTRRGEPELAKMYKRATELQRVKEKHTLNDNTTKEQNKELRSSNESFKEHTRTWNKNNNRDSGIVLDDAMEIFAVSLV